MKLLLIVCNLQPDSDIGKAGIATHKYFLSRLAKLLPYIDLEIAAATPTTEQLPRPAKRRKLNPKSAKGSGDEQLPATPVKDKETNNQSASSDSNWD